MALPQPERRFLATAPTIEVRAEGDAPPVVVGHASVFDQWTTLYEGRYWTWREVVRPGAFARAIKERQDVRALFNHDPNYVLGRTTSGTVELSEDAKGLVSRITPPATQTIRDLVIEPIRRGDVSQMSFAFTPRKGDVTTTKGQDGTTTIASPGERTILRYEGERLIEEREILDADLYDVSPVTYPAYGGTDVGVRSIPDLRALIAEKDRPHVAEVVAKEPNPAPIRDSYRAWLEGKRK